MQVNTYKKKHISYFCPYFNISKYKAHLNRRGSVSFSLSVLSSLPLCKRWVNRLSVSDTRCL